MEKFQFPVNDSNHSNWNSSTGTTSNIFSIDVSTNELHSVVPDYGGYFNPSDWDVSIDQNDPFESAYSSIVSSPTATSYAMDETVMMNELIGRLGSICNSGNNNNSNNNNNGNNNHHIIGSSTNTSCYSTPLNSPPRSNSRPGNHSFLGNHSLPGNSPISGTPPFPGTPPYPGTPRFHGNEPFQGNHSFPGNHRFSHHHHHQISRSYGAGMSESPKLESGRLSRVLSSRSIDVSHDDHQFRAPDVKNNGELDQKFVEISRPSSPGNAGVDDSREGSSVSEQNTGGKVQGESSNPRKRKSNPRGKGKEMVPSPVVVPNKQDKVDEGNVKRSKEEVKAESESTKANGSRNPNCSEVDEKSKDTPKPPEAPKDYIHVRARRGQATDSHSLAERVRREKISERMKFLQDLVPGCNKVTGKAVVLDEIINYVQSLQRQVEFLSMKLAAVHPRMDFNMESLLSKDMLQPHGTLAQPMYALEASVQALQYAFQAQQLQHLQNCLSNGSDVSASFSIHSLNAALLGNQGIQLPSADRFNSSISQAPTLWENNLQNIVQTSNAQNQTQKLHGQMKPEL